MAETERPTLPGPAAPRRIQRRRTRGWRLPDNATYVGRPTMWGNLARTDRPTIWWIEDDGRRTRINRTLTPTEAVLQYRRANGEGWDSEGWEQFCALVREQLRGRDLACWCPLVDEHGAPVPCHGDALLEIAGSGARP